MAEDEVRDAVEALLAEGSGYEAAFSELLAVDEAEDAWGFEDVGVDSGRFGELVSRGVVERAGDGRYRLADPVAVRSAVDGEATRADAGTEADAGTPITLPGIDRFRSASTAERSVIRRWRRRELDALTAGALAAAFGMLLAMRLLNLRAVFRDDLVVLPANDPYHYRYWVDRLLEQAPTVADVGVLASMPSRTTVGEPLTYAMGWGFAVLFGGGDPAAAGAVVAWLPVACAMAVGAMVYALATALTGDRRAGIASVGMFAVVPAHAVYSGIGFFDHHPFDYVWLTLTALCLVWLAVDLERAVARVGVAGAGSGSAPSAGAGPVADHLRRPGTWAVALALALALTMQAFQWNGAPLLYWALALYLALRALSDIRADHPSLLANAPVVAALAVAAVAAHLLHVGLGWQEPVVVYTPLLVTVGAVGVLGVADLVRRLGWPTWVQLVAEVGTATAVVVGIRLLRPSYFGRLLVRSDALFGREGIAETRALFTPDLGFVLGPLDHFGLVYYVAAPVLAAAAWFAIREHRPSWLVLASYGWYLTGLAAIQLRFTGELSPFVAVAGGVGLVHLLSTLDIARRPAYAAADRYHAGAGHGLPVSTVGRPDATGIVYGAAVVLVIASLSVFMAWSLTGFIAIDDDQYETVTWLREDTADAIGDRPDYVLSQWSWNRMYNYHVNGEADGYGYAASNYEPFLATEDPDGAFYDRFEGRVGYVVIEELELDADVRVPPASAYARLYERLGAAGDGVDGVGHFRARYVTSNGEIAVFEVVPGATVVGAGPPNSTVTVTTPVEIPGGSFEYVRTARTDADGRFTVILAQPGTYELDGLEEPAGELRVTEADVRDGATIELD